MSAPHAHLFLETPRFPVCAQCRAPMLLDRVEPGSNISKMRAIFRCETCRLADQLTVADLQGSDDSEKAA
jgi:hypothetical protein